VKTGRFSSLFSFVAFMRIFGNVICAFNNLFFEIRISCKLSISFYAVLAAKYVALFISILKNYLYFIIIG